MSKVVKVEVERGQILGLYNAQAHMASHPHPRWLDMAKNLQEIERASKENQDLFKKASVQKKEETDADYQDRLNQYSKELGKDKMTLNLYTFTHTEFKDQPLVATKIMSAIDVIIK